MTITLFKGITTNPFQKPSSHKDEKKFHIFLAQAFWAGVFFIVAASLLTLPHLSGAGGDTVHVVETIGYGLGEALLVAYIVAVLIEPYMRSWYASQSGAELWWAVHRKNIPPAMRKAITALASSEEFNRQVTWKMRFDRTPEGYFFIELEVHARGVAIDEPVHPQIGMWIMPSESGRRGSYTGWQMEIPDLDGAVWTIDEEDFQRIQSGQSSVSAYYPDDVVVPVGKTYITRKVAIIYPSGDWIPLRCRCLTERFYYDISGPAARDLEFTVKHPDRSDAGVKYYFDPGKKYITFEGPQDSFTFPGQVTLISWRPRPHPEGEAEQTASKPGVKN